jgi:Tol biopolymer transport system component
MGGNMSNKGIIFVMMVFFSSACLVGRVTKSDTPTQTPRVVTTHPELPPSTVIPKTEGPVTPTLVKGPLPPIAFTATGWCVKGSGEEIFLVNPDGSDVRCITNSAGDDRDPSWSPDGSRIAFSSKRDGNWQIYVMDADGSNQIRVTVDNLHNDMPSWSPDGKQILYQSSPGKGTSIRLVNIDGTNDQALTKYSDKREDLYPHWSPDGQSIVFSSFGGGSTAGIYVMHPDGSDIHLLKAGPLHNPVWSPDGEQIAFDGEPAGCKFEIYIMNADGSKMHVITNHPEGCGGYNKHPAWSPDGKWLTFTSRRKFDTGSRSEIFKIRIDGTGETQLTFRQEKFVSDGFDPDWRWAE